MLKYIYIYDWILKIAYAYSDLEINEQLLNTFNHFKNGLINFNEYKNKINITITSSHLINKIVLKNIKINLKDEVLNLDDLKLFDKKIPKNDN